MSVLGALPVLRAPRGGIRFGPSLSPTWFTDGYGRDETDIAYWRYVALPDIELTPRVVRSWDRERWDDDDWAGDIELRAYAAQVAACSCAPCRRSDLARQQVERMS